MGRREGVVLINPPSAPGMTANREGAAGLGHLDQRPAGFYYPPQTLAYMAASLQREGWSVRVVDAVGEGLNAGQTLARLQQAEEPFFALFVSYATREADSDFLRALKRSLPERRVLAFGISTRYMREELRRSPPAGVLFGEPEGAVGAALLHLDAGGPECLELAPRDLGLANYDAEGLLIELDELPFPAWELLPWARYPFLTVSGSRGCGDRCRYCPYVVAQGARFRGRSPEKVVAEMAWLVRNFQPRRVIFRDPVFAWDRERVMGICEGLLSKGIRLRWECESRPEHFDAALLRLMWQAGCRAIKIGLETASAPLLSGLGRTQEADVAAYRAQVAEVVRICRHIGIDCRVFVMLGLPGETQAALQETLAFLQEISPLTLQAQRFQAYPGLRLSDAEMASAPAVEEALWEQFRQASASLAAEGKEMSLAERVRRIGWGCLRWLMAQVGRDRS